MTTTNFSMFDIQFFAGEGGEGAGGQPISVTTNAEPAQDGGTRAGSVTSLTQTPTTDGGQTPAAPASGEPGSPTPQTPPAEPKAKAPESYQPFTLPAEMPAENPQVKEALAEASGVFKELGLTQEQGQKLIDLHAKHWLGGMLNQQELFEQELTAGSPSGASRRRRIRSSEGRGWARAWRASGAPSRTSEGRSWRTRWTRRRG